MTPILVLAWSLGTGTAPKPAESATLHVVVDYADAVIETRSSVDPASWLLACAAPCDRPLAVEDRRIRVSAPRMTPSNEFLVEPGSGIVRLRVSGGSAVARDLGILGLAGGIPLALGGGALFGVGSVQDHEGLRTAGIVTLAVGAAAIVASLPLLLVGSTRVYDSRGTPLARRPQTRFAF
jgi:hypothetical protein